MRACVRDCYYYFRSDWEICFHFLAYEYFTSEMCFIVELFLHVSHLEAAVAARGQVSQ